MCRNNVTLKLVQCINFVQFNLHCCFIKLAFSLFLFFRCFFYKHFFKKRTRKRLENFAHFLFAT